MTERAEQTDIAAVTSGPRARGRAKTELHIVFDSNILHTDSFLHLVQLQVKELVDVKYDDLALFWYVPHTVRHERQFQMIKAGHVHLPRLAQFGALMGVSMGMSAEELERKVKDRVQQQLEEIGLVE